MPGEKKKKQTHILKGNRRHFEECLLVWACLFSKTAAAGDSIHITRNKKSARTTGDACDDIKSLLVAGWSELLD